MPSQKRVPAKIRTAGDKNPQYLIDLDWTNLESVCSERYTSLMYNHGVFSNYDTDLKKCTMRALACEYIM